MTKFDENRITSKHRNTHTLIPISALQTRPLGQVATMYDLIGFKCSTT